MTLRRSIGAGILAAAALAACSAPASDAAGPELETTPRSANATPPIPTPATTPPATATTAAPTTATTAAPTTSTTAVACTSRSIDRPQLAAAIDARIAAVDETSLELSVAVATTDGALVYQRNGDQRLLPASNQKIFTAIGAFELLPQDFAFDTMLLIDSSPDAEHTGELYLRAGGDPTLVEADLRSLARQARASGLEIVKGDLVVDSTHFAGERAAPGWPEWLQPTYAGPMSALIVDDNRWRTDAAFLDDPNVGNGERLRAALEREGVAVTGDVRNGTVPSDATVVGTVSSLGRDELLLRMLRSSDNEHADALVREIGRRHTGTGSTRAGTRVIQEHIESHRCAPLRGDDGDGSGLSRENLRSAIEWTELLTLTLDQAWSDQFTNSLPIAGQTGTLSSRLAGQATFGNVRAKTGTIIGGRSLSGFVDAVGGERLIFSVVVNGDGAADARSLIDAIVTAIAVTPTDQA